MTLLLLLLLFKDAFVMSPQYNTGNCPGKNSSESEAVGNSVKADTTIHCMLAYYVTQSMFTSCTKRQEVRMIYLPGDRYSNTVTLRSHCFGSAAIFTLNGVAIPANITTLLCSLSNVEFVVLDLFGLNRIKSSLNVSKTDQDCAQRSLTPRTWSVRRNSTAPAHAPVLAPVRIETSPLSHHCNDTAE